MSPGKRSPRKTRTPDNLSPAVEAKPEQLFNGKSAASDTQSGNVSYQAVVINSSTLTESSQNEAFTRSEKERGKYSSDE